MKRWFLAAAALLGAAAVGFWLWFGAGRGEDSLAWGRRQLAAGDADAALRAAEQTLRAEPRSAPAQALKAAALTKLLRTREALAAFALAPPRDADERFLFGSALMLSGQLSEAAAAFQQALAERPDHDDARWALGRMQETLGQRREALANAEALTRSPAPRSRAMGWWMACKLRHELGDFAGSEAARQEFAALDAARQLPEPVEAFHARVAENYLALGKPDDAEKAAENLRTGPAGKLGGTLRARAAEARGERDRALAAYAAVARRFGEDRALWLTALAKAKAWGKREIGAKLAAEAVAKHPADAELKSLAAEFPPPPP